MPSLLRIDSSSRTQGSHSSQLADRIQAAWIGAHPDGQVVTRHLTASPLPFISAETITGFYTPPGEVSDNLRAATALSDELITELKAADTLLIAAPIYNFSAPASLKAWIDQITRIGQTFSYENGAFQGLLPTKQAIVACAYGAE